ncbi:MAG: hypothetical protein QM731_19000 [Chitinophagaceae bacterium]
MEEKQPDVFRQLKSAHLAILGCFTLVVLAVIALLQTHRFAVNKSESLDRTLQVVLMIISLGMVISGFNLFRKKIMQIRGSVDTDGVSRMKQYRTACIIWWAMIEVPGMFAAIGFLITGNYAFLALALFHLAILAVFMPRKQNIILLLNLTETDVKRLEGQ